MASSLDYLSAVLELAPQRHQLHNVTDGALLLAALHGEALHDRLVRVELVELCVQLPLVLFES